MNNIAYLKFLGINVPFLMYHIQSIINIFSRMQKFQENVFITQIGNL